MARRRMIDPGFWSSEHNLKLNIRERLLFLGLISNSDDKGRIKGNPNYLRSQIFPYDDIACPDIIADLKILSGEKLIIIYRVNDIDYIKITNWEKYQRIDHPYPSKIPAPVEITESVCEIPNKFSGTTVNSAEAESLNILNSDVDFDSVMDYEDNSEIDSKSDSKSNSKNESMNESENESENESWNHSENDSKNGSENHSFLSESKIKENKRSENSVSEEEAFHSHLHEYFSLFHLTCHDPPVINSPIALN